MQKKMRCCLCGEPAQRIVLCKNGVDLVSCEKDGMVFLKLCPPETELREVYEEGYFGQGGETGANYIRDFPQMKYNAVLRLQEISKLRPLSGARLLDIGCAAGAFVEAAQELACNAYGIDISRFATEYGKKRGLKVFQGETPQVIAGEQNWDIVTLWHVLEHVPDPKGLLARLRSVMGSGSLLVIELPDVASLPARFLREKWKMISIPEHLWYFSENTLKRLLASCGYRTFSTKHTSFTNLLSPIKSMGSKSALAFLQKNLKSFGWIKKAVNRSKGLLGLHDCLTVYAQRE